MKKKVFYAVFLILYSIVLVQYVEDKIRLTLNMIMIILILILFELIDIRNNKEGN